MIMRARIVFVLLGIAVYIYGVSYVTPNIITHTVLDISTWLSAILITIGGVAELIAYGDKYRALSSSILAVLGVILAIGARVIVTIYTGYYYGFSNPPFCNHVIPHEVLGLLPLVLGGGVLVLVSQLINYIFKSPITFAPVGPTYRDLINGLLGFSRAFRNGVSKYYFIVAFTIPFLLRLIPEIQAWPLPIGWDTIEYIGYLRDYAERLNPFSTYLWMGRPRNIPPLMAIFLTPFIKIVDPWYLMKIWEPLILGLASMLTAIYIRRELKASPTIALIAGLTSTLNIVTLGATNQWARHMLGLVTVLLFLILSTNKKSLGTILALIAMALAYELTAVLALAISVYYVFKNISNWRNTLKYVGLFIILLTISLWYVTAEISSDNITGSLRNVITFAWNWVNAANFVFGWTIMFLIGLLPSIKPLRRTSTETKIIIILLLLDFLSPILCPHIIFIAPHRALIMFVSFLFALAVVGLREYSRTALAIFVVFNIVLGILYITVPSGYIYTAPIRAMSNVSFTCCGLQGFPWSMKPYRPELFDCFKKIAETIELDDNVFIVTDRTTFLNYLHLYVRDLYNHNIVNIGVRPDNTILREKITKIFNMRNEEARIYLITSLSYNEIYSLLDSGTNNIGSINNIDIILVFKDEKCNVNVYLISNRK